MRTGTGPARLGAVVSRIEARSSAGPPRAFGAASAAARNRSTSGGPGGAGRLNSVSSRRRISGSSIGAIHAFRIRWYRIGAIRAALRVDHRPGNQVDNSVDNEGANPYFGYRRRFDPGEVA